MDAKRKIWMWAGIAAAVVVAGIAVWYFTMGSQASVPDVVGSKASDAVRTLEDSGFALGKTTSATSTTQPVGTVVAEDPAPGTKAPRGSTVNLTVVASPQLISVPRVVSLEASAAATMITAAGLAPTVYRDFNAAPVGTVYAQVPLAGQSVGAGTSVVLGVSLGAAPVAPKVPNVVGKTKDAATTALKNAGFGARVYESYSADVASGIVISQFPTANTQQLPGSDVAIQVSKGKAPSTPTNVSVPNVTGKPEADATAALKNAGLSVETYHEFSDKVAKGSVMGQLPAAGSSVAKGTVVAIAISDGKAPESVTVPDVTGKTTDEATAALTAVGLKPVVVPDPKSKEPQGVVLSQLPAGGSKVAPNSQVVLQVPGAAPTPY